jgi:hypothetical protein
MQVYRRGMLALAVVAAGIANAAQAGAQERRLWEWDGRVDREVEIAMRGTQTWLRGATAYDDAQPRPRAAAALPRTQGWVTVELRDGRGEVDVVQQPTRQNDYTLIVRIRDRSTGTGRYRIRAWWENDTGRGRWPSNPRQDDRYERPSDRGWPSTGVDARPRIDDRGGYDPNPGAGVPGRRGTPALVWRGLVDDEVELRIQGDRVQYRTLSGASVRDARAMFTNGGIPRREVTVELLARQGRGSIWITEQPSARNAYTLVVRIRDQQAGAWLNEFELLWR